MHPSGMHTVLEIHVLPIFLSKQLKDFYYRENSPTCIMKRSLPTVTGASSRTPLYLYEILHYLDVAAPDNVCLGRGGGGEVGGDR